MGLLITGVLVGTGFPGVGVRSRGKPPLVVCVKALGVVVAGEVVGRKADGLVTGVGETVSIGVIVA